MDKTTSPEQEYSPDADKFALGGVIRNFGLRRDDSRAFDGLLNLQFWEIFGRLPADTKEFMDLRVGDVLVQIVNDHSSALAITGAVLEFHRRKHAYFLARDNWMKSDQTGPMANWRKRSMTRGQRFLIAAVCHELKVAPPQNLNRGLAADWLEKMGAHPLLRDDND